MTASSACARPASRRTAEAAFAGAAETYLFVSMAELLERIKEVWTSFWLTRGILYQSDRVVRQGSARLAIVVQQMFDSRVSRVIFTTDPVSGRDVIVIERAMPARRRAWYPACHAV